MNQKGLAISGILYTLLIIFMVLLISLLASFQNRKTILDELKLDAVNAVEKETNIEALFDEIEKLKTAVSSIKEAYPVGSIYITTKNVNPSELLGGTWEAYGEGRTLIGANKSTYKVNTTGGSTTVKLTTANLPSHNHTFTGTKTNYTSGNQSSNHTHSIPALSGTAASSGSAHVHYGRRSAQSSGFMASALTHDSTPGLSFVYNGDLLVRPTQNTSISTAVNDSDGAHTHSISTNASTTGGISANHTHTTSVTPKGTIGSTGDGVSFSVQNPYIAVYMWKRIA